MGDILSDVQDMKISSNLILASWNCWERDIILNFFSASVILAMTLH